MTAAIRALFLLTGQGYVEGGRRELVPAAPEWQVPGGTHSASLRENRDGSRAKAI